MLNREPSSVESFPAEKDRRELRVMSYNIRIDHCRDQNTSHDWALRSTMVATLVSYYSPDIVALQEVTAKQLDDLRQLLPHYQFVGYPAGVGKRCEEWLLFAYLPHRLRLQESAVFSLSPTPEQPAKGWDALYHRACVYGRFFDLQAKRLLSFFNTHLDHKGEIAREKSVELLALLQGRLSLKSPFLILGDFNFYPEQGGDRLYQQMLSFGLQDVRDLCEESYGPDGTWIGWEYDSTRSGEGKIGDRLDHFFTAGSLFVKRCGVIQSSLREKRVVTNFPVDRFRLFPSDHLPIAVDLYF